MPFVEFLIIFSLFGAAYSYFIYPLILLSLPKNNNLNLKSSNLPINELPHITLIITAYNEASRIEQKILNTLEINYPADKREILVASDGSTDDTNKIIQNYGSKGVRLIEVSDRKGKENAQLAAIKAANSNLLIFSDVATQIPKDACKRIVEAFANERIGAISSEDRFITERGAIAGEGAYVKYEMWLRRLEARVKSLVGLSGSFFACRKEICENWDINVPSDFTTALNCNAYGLVAVSHPKVLGFYPNLKDESKEYQRKLRTVIRGMAAISHKPSCLNPFKHGIFAFEIFSHKIMRWLVPWFQLLLLITTLSQVDASIYINVLLALQLTFYTLALIGWLSITARESNLFKIPFFFMQVNIAIAHAGIQFISGKRITKWEPSKR